MRIQTNPAAPSQLRDKAELLRILGHPVRLAIIQKLVKGPKCVTDIRDLLDVPQANVSQHLTALRTHRIVGFHEDGKQRCYYLTRPALAKLVLEFIGAKYPVVECSAEEVRKGGKRRRVAQKCAE